MILKFQMQKSGRRGHHEHAHLQHGLLGGNIPHQLMATVTITYLT